MTFVPLSHILADARPAGHAIALRNSATQDFGHFAASVSGMAARLREDRVGRVALSCGDSYGFAVGLFGAWYAGCHVVLPPSRHATVLDSLRDAFDIVLDDAYLARAERRHRTLPPLDGQSSALDFFTSGSTAGPKRIARNLAMLDREVAALALQWKDGLDTGPVYATVPYHHAYGLVFKLLWPLSVGCAFVAETHDLWEGLLGDITAGAVIVSSPAHLGRMGGLAPLPDTRRPSRVFSAGAPLPPTAAREAERLLGVRPQEIFGSTETGAVATRRPGEDDAPWVLLPGIAMHCDEGSGLAFSLSANSEEWVSTGDIGSPVAGGFHLLGRSDRIVKIEGLRVSLHEVEEILLGLPWITAAAAVMVGDPQRLAAALVLNDRGATELSRLGRFRFGRALRSALAMRCDPSAIPRLWRYVKELPTTPMGKRRSSDIRALFDPRS